MVLLKGGDTADSSPVLLILLMCATISRYYADVEYRLSLNYRRFSLYYIIIAAGYLLGLLLYFVTRSWALILIAGETCGLLFVAFTGKVFRRPFFGTGPFFGRHFRMLAVISLSFLLSDFVAGADRLLLPILLANGDELTAMFYYASVVGKMMSLLSTPLNGVLAGHIAKKEGGLTRKQFLRVVLLMLGIFVLVTAVSVLGSHIFVYLFYRPYYAQVKSLFLLANAGQVIFFICNTMMVVVLRFTDEKIQMAVSAAYIVLFLTVTIPLILKFGITGMAWGIFAVNFVKFILYIILGLLGLKKGEPHEEKAE